MMKILLITIITLVVRSSNAIQEKDSAHILHGFFGDFDEVHVFYGTLNFDTSQFNMTSALNISDVGNPRHVKYFVLPMTYDPNNDVVYMAAPDNNNKPILSVINATSGSLIRTFKSISNTIISLQYDIFRNQLFAHIDTNRENVTQIIEIDTNNGNLKQILGTIRNVRPTYMSSYCPICRKYFLFGIQNNNFIYIGVNSTDGGGISWQSSINVFPSSMRFDYKTFTMYTVYKNQTNQFISSLGILNRTIDGISQTIAIISDDPRLVATTLSAYDIDQNIYYSSIQSIFPYSGIVYVNVKTAEEKQILLPKSKFESYGWFVKQFVH